MPRYFFDLDATEAGKHNDGTDDVGIELPDLQAARRAALEFLPRYAGDRLGPDQEHQALGLHVRDDNGDTVYRASLVLSGERPVASLV